VMDGGKGLQLLASRINATIERAIALPGFAEQGNTLAATLAQVGAATKAAWATGNPEEALANATPYLQAFGHLVLGWIWLDVALCAQARAATLDDALLQGKLAACRFFFRHELPRVGAWLQVVTSRDDTCRTMDEAWF
jgi:Acetyl-CoA dehydrogenase C-terminal like